MCWGECGERGMKTIRIVATCVAVATLLTACAGRSPNPVALVQPMDQSLTCDAIYAEVAADNKKIADLGGEQGAKVAQNVAAGIAGVFIWPLWFAMDFQ